MPVVQIRDRLFLLIGDLVWRREQDEGGAGIAGSEVQCSTLSICNISIYLLLIVVSLVLSPQDNCEKQVLIDTRM